MIIIVMKAIHYLWTAFDKIIFRTQALSIDKKINNYEATYVHIINCYSFERVLKCQKIMDNAYRLTNAKNIETFSQ
jgi:hypothetical protein